MRINRTAYPLERLEAIPWTRFSIEAETELENPSHPHIGSLRTVQAAGEESFETPFDLELETLSGGLTEEHPRPIGREENV